MLWPRPGSLLTPVIRATISGELMDDPHSKGRLRITGVIHVLEVRAGIAHVRIGDGKNLTLQQGADAARELCDDLLQVLELTNHFLHGLIIDVRRAPSITGPKTRAVLGQALRAWERANLPVVFVVGDQPIKETQFTGLVREHAPTQGKVTKGYQEAQAHCTDNWRRKH